MDISERLDEAEDLFCDEKYEESDREFERLLKLASDEEEACQIVERWVSCLMERYYELQDIQEYDEALVLCEKAIKTLRLYQHRFVEKILMARNDRAGFLKEIERYDEAEAEYKDLVLKCRLRYGIKAHDTYIAMGNLAGVYCDTGRSLAAISLRSRAVNGFLELYGEENSDYIRELINLAHDYENIGNYAKAIPMLEKAYKLRQRKRGKSNDLTINVLFQFAVCFKRIQQSYEAVRLYKIAVSRIKSDDFYTLIHKVQYAICLAWIGKEKQARLLADQLSGQIGSSEFGVDVLQENMEYLYSSIALYKRDYNKALMCAKKAAACIEDAPDGERRFSAEKYIAEMSFYAGEYQSAYTILERISDFYETTEYNVVDLLMYYYIRANVTASLGLFAEAEKCVFRTMTVSRQCTFAAAPFLAYSAKAFLALKRGEPENFERLRSIALGYARAGMDMREFEVVWIRDLQ